MKIPRGTLSATGSNKPPTNGIMFKRNRIHLQQHFIMEQLIS